MPVCPIAHLHDCLAAESSRTGRKAVRLMFFRVVVTALIRRGLDSRLEAPRRQRENKRSTHDIMNDLNDDQPPVVIGFLPYWDAVPMDRLRELYSVLAQFFDHHTNRLTLL
jgi:hypothetical protein